LIPDRMDALGLDRESEGDARAKLEAAALIAFAAKVGAKNRLFAPTARGREFAGARGLPVASTGKGGEGHAAIVEYTQQSLGRHSAAFRFQRAGVSPTNRLHVSRDTVERWIHTSQLRAANVGTALRSGRYRPSWRVPNEALEEFLNSRFNKPASVAKPRVHRRDAVGSIIEFIK